MLVLDWPRLMLRSSIGAHLERIQEKWAPVFRPNGRSNKDSEHVRESIFCQRALDSFKVWQILRNLKRFLRVDGFLSDQRGNIGCCIVILGWSVLVPVAADAQSLLALEQAEQIALGDDPILAQLDARAGAFDDQAVADGQLPDPRVKIGLMSLPLDSFDFTKERMTQAQFGLSQSFPRGRTLSLRRDKTETFANVERARRQDQESKIILAVRRSWLDLFYWRRATEIVGKQKTAVRNLIGIVESLYITGRQTQQDLIRAELEFSLLEDRELEIKRQMEVSRVELAKWIDAEFASRPLPTSLPNLPSPKSLDDLKDGLEHHPSIRVENFLLAASKTDVELAEQAYKPAWSVDLTYGLRGDEDVMGRQLPDFGSVMVVLDVPLFTKKRQDKRLSASKQRAAAMQYQRVDQLRELRRQLEAEYATWLRLDERARLYQQAITVQSGRNLEASINGYQSDVTDFSALMRAQILDLDTELQALRIRIDRAKAQALLLYLQGDQS